MKNKFKKLYLKIAILFTLAALLFSCSPKANASNASSVASVDTKEVKQETSAIKEKSLAEIQKERKKAKDSLNLKYSKKREDFASDVIYANFRNVKLGKLKENIFYRGASPIDNSYNRAKYANELIKSVNIKYDVDLSDNKEKVEKNSKKNDFTSDYFLSLNNEGKVSLLHMSTDFTDVKNHKKAVEGITAMSKNEGPYYVHCVEGKHRTGFFCIIVEALAGATYEEMADDFMTTFYNYNGITKETNKEAYDIIKTYYVDGILETIAGISETGTDLTKIDWVSKAKNFLIKNGMKEEDLANWYKNLTTE